MNTKETIEIQELTMEEISVVSGGGFFDDLWQDVKEILRTGSTGSTGPQPSKWGQGPPNAAMSSHDV